MTGLPFAAASDPCDPMIKQNPEDPQGYQARNEQICEGMYATEVSSLGLMLASFTAPLHGIDMARETRLRFAWKAALAGEVRIRIDSLRPRVYYRMDAVRPHDQSDLLWTNSIPARNALRTGELGLLATQADSSGNLVYLPLRVSHEDQAPTSGPWVVSVISGTELEEVYWSLSQTGEAGFIVYDEPLAQKPYPANQPIAIRLDQVAEAGIYELTISAELRGGAVDTLKVSFHHDP